MVVTHDLDAARLPCRRGVRVDHGPIGDRIDAWVSGEEP